MDIIDDKSVGVIEEDPERKIVVIAKPVGVIGALSPSTNPEATPVIKAINAVKGRNSIIIAPHPRAKLTNKLVCDLMREAIVAMGAPADLVIGIDTPTLDKTNELMRQCDRILATGGGPMVNAAYSSGTPGARRRRRQCGDHRRRDRRPRRCRREDPHLQDARLRRVLLGRQ